MNVAIASTLLDFSNNEVQKASFSKMQYTIYIVFITIENNTMLYNLIVNTSKRVLFLPPSDAYVRSFLYLLYTLIKLYYTYKINK